MPYVRQRGRQLLIVHGVRDPNTRAVEQCVLFTLYTRDEASDVLGLRDPPTASVFQQLLEKRHPDLRFDWKALRTAISGLLPVLPEHAEDDAQTRGGFHVALASFTRQLALAAGGAAPALTHEAEALRAQLLVARELLDVLLGVKPDAAPTRLPPWAFALRDHELPQVIEERWAEAYERGEDDRAEAAFTLLTCAFPDYAEGHNYLGLIALRRDRPEEAATHFRRTTEVGRRRFPRRIARDRWWSDLATRPYMRGLRNLALALLHAGRDEEALAVCGQLETECYDSITASAHRAVACLNLGRWTLARDAGLYLHQLAPSSSLLVALAAFEMGLHDEARAHLLHASLDAPRRVARVLGERLAPPVTPDEARDHNGGIEQARALRGYVATRGGGWRRFFRDLWRCDLFVRLRSEHAALTARWQNDRTGKDRVAFDRRMVMQTIAFAQQAVGLPPGALAEPEAASARSPRRAERALRTFH